jgi:hypothetical protein
MNNLLDKYKKLDFMDQIYLYSLYLEGSHESLYSKYYDPQKETLSVFMDIDPTEDGAKYTLTEEARELFDEHPEVLEAAKEYCSANLPASIKK